MNCDKCNITSCDDCAFNKTNREETYMNKVITVLKALDIGIPIKIKIGKYYEELYLAEDNGVCVKRGDNYISIDYSFKGFVNMCNKMSDDEIFLLNSNIALNKIKR